MKTSDIDAAVRGLAPTHTDDLITDAAWSQVAENVTSEHAAPAVSLEPRRRPAGPRLVFAAAAGLLIAGVVAAAAVNLPGQDLPQAMSVTDQGEWLTVRVIDQNADPKAYNQQLEKLGLNIKVKMVPVAPSAVGKYATFLYYEGSDGSKLGLLKPGDNCPATLNASDPGCQYGVEVGKKFKGKAEIQFGRAARPGEMYQYIPSEAGAPGEELAGLSYKNERVSEVQKLIAARGVTIGGYVDSETEMVDGVNTAKEVDPAPGDWYVHEAQPQSPGVVILWIGSEPEK